MTISNDLIIVGTPEDDDNEFNSGSSYLFSKDGDFITKLLAPDGAGSDYFGWSVAASDNLIVVGAYGVEAVYV